MELLLNYTFNHGFSLGILAGMAISGLLWIGWHLTGQDEDTVETYRPQFYDQGKDEGSFFNLYVKNRPQIK